MAHGGRSLAALVALTFAACGGGGGGDDGASPPAGGTAPNADGGPPAGGESAGGTLGGGQPGGGGTGGAPTGGGLPDASPVGGTPDADEGGLPGGVIPDAGAGGAPTVDAGPAVDATPPPPRQDDDGLVINEFMASNHYSLFDENELTPDWLELYNGTDHALDLGGYIFTTDPERLDPELADALPDGLTIEAGGHLLLRFDPGAPRAPDRVALNLEKAGGTITLLRPDGTEVESLDYFAQTADLSAARTPDGSNVWNIVWEISPGGANPDMRGRPSNVVPAADGVANKYLFDVLPEFRFTVSEANLESLRVQPREYVEADLTFQGRTIRGVGLRLKGQNSFLPIDRKPSLKIKIDYTNGGALFMGLDTVTLNNMSGDPTLVHEVMGYWMARSAGLYASRAGSALVYINDAFYGVYSNIETVDKRFLSRWFADTTGSLYESFDVDFRPNLVALECDEVNDPPAHGCYELEAGEPDKTALIALADALTRPGPEAIDAASQFVDFDQFHLYWGVCGTIGQFDSFPYSNPGDDYYIYVEPESQRITFMPWGMDETYPGRPGRNIEGVSSMLTQRCLEDENCTRGWRLALWSMLDLARDLDAPAEMDARVALIEPWIDQDMRKPLSTAQVEAAQRAMRDFIVHRQDDVERMVPRP